MKNPWGLKLAGGFWIEGLNQHLSPKGGKPRQALPKGVLFLSAENLLENREVGPISRHQMVKALSDAPLVGAWLPVKLSSAQMGKHCVCVLRDLLRFGD